MMITKHNPHPKKKKMNVLFVGRNVTGIFAQKVAEKRTKMITKN
jgi:hypothetical protein